MDDLTRSRIYAADQAAKTLAGETGLDIEVGWVGSLDNPAARVWVVWCLNACCSPWAPVAAGYVGVDDLDTVDELRAALRWALLRPGVRPAPIHHADRPATSAATSERLIRQFLGQPTELANAA